jgi:hypothetical protein
MKDFIIKKTFVCDWDMRLKNMFQKNSEHFGKELNTQSDIDKYCDLLNQNNNLEKEYDVLGKA